jgi:hypothetical protein
MATTDTLARNLLERAADANDRDERHDLMLRAIVAELAGITARLDAIERRISPTPSKSATEAR